MGNSAGGAALLVAAVGILLLPPAGWRRAPRRPRGHVSESTRRAVRAGLIGAAGPLLLGAPWWLTVTCTALGGAAAYLAPRRAETLTPAELRQCAVFFDSLAACVDAGLAVDRAVAACLAVLSVPGAAGAALAETASLLALGSPPSSAWQPVVRISALAGAGRAAARSADGGTRFARAARITASELRARHRALDRSRSARAGVLVTAPLALCFLPAFLCLGLAPVIVSLLASLHIW